MKQDNLEDYYKRLENKLDDIIQFLNSKENLIATRYLNYFNYISLIRKYVFKNDFLLFLLLI
jgi:hypothetical protein